MKRREEDVLPLDTLPSLVIDERNEEFADEIEVQILKLSFP